MSRQYAIIHKPNPSSRTGTLLKTVPTTAEGCRALARFVSEYWPKQGYDLSDNGPAILRLIAKSPML